MLGAIQSDQEPEGAQQLLTRKVANAIVGLMAIWPALLTVGCAQDVQRFQPSDDDDQSSFHDREAFIPGDGFTPDGQRIVDLATLRWSLARFHQDVGRYPVSLDELSSAYLPAGLTEPPTDPTTGRSYAYKEINNGGGYELRAKLSNGELFDSVNLEFDSVNLEEEESRESA